jgi:excisionase family DNA binding protein
MDQTKKYYTTSEVAKLLGLSRIAVYKQIKSGKIVAQKIGRNFVVLAHDLPAFLQPQLSTETKEKITQAVKKVVDEYGSTLKKLGQE